MYVVIIIKVYKHSMAMLRVGKCTAKGIGMKNVKCTAAFLAR